MIDVDFFKVYACVGLWCSLFMAILAIFEAPLIMKYAKRLDTICGKLKSTILRSLEELFGLFVSLALTFKAIMAVIRAVGRFDPLRCSDNLFGFEGVFPAPPPHPPPPPPPPLPPHLNLLENATHHDNFGQRFKQ